MRIAPPDSVNSRIISLGLPRPVGKVAPPSGLTGIPAQPKAIPVSAATNIGGAVSGLLAQLRAFFANLAVPKAAAPVGFRQRLAAAPTTATRTAVPLPPADRFMVARDSAGALPDFAPETDVMSAVLAVTEAAQPPTTAPPLRSLLPPPTYIPDAVAPALPKNPDQSILDSVGASAAVYVGPPEVAKAPSQLTAADLAQLGGWLANGYPVGFAGYRWLPKAAP